MAQLAHRGKPALVRPPSEGELKVLVEFERYRFDNETAPSEIDLAERLNVSRTLVQNRFRSLEAKGYMGQGAARRRGKFLTDLGKAAVLKTKKFATKPLTT